MLRIKLNSCTLGKHSTTELHPSHTPRVSHPASLTVRNENKFPGAAAGLGTSLELPPHSKNLVGTGRYGCKDPGTHCVQGFLEEETGRRRGGQCLGTSEKRHKMKYIGLCGCCKVFSGSRDADGDRDVVT